MNFLTPLPSNSNSSEDLFVYSSGSIPILAKELNLKQTLLGGQAFRWIEQNSNEFLGVLGPFVVRLSHQNDQLRYIFLTNNEHLIQISNDNDRRVESALILEDYFQLTINLNNLIDKWSKSDQRFEQGQIPIGIRVLAQEPLENVISFICSSNNNVQRITKMIKGLCDEYGRKIGTLDGIDFHQFPTLDELDKNDLEKRLRELNFGYRARYISEAVHFLRHTVDGMKFFDRLKLSSTNDARKELLRIMGIGRKVADCILLMSLGKHEVVPVDTHIHSIAMNYYAQQTDKKSLNVGNYDGISSFFEQLWQPCAGWAQAAAFSNELRLFTSSPRTSTKSSRSLKRSISKTEILVENNPCQTIKRQKKLQPISSRPKRNIKPIDRY